MEIAGLGLVGVEIWKDRKAARRVLEDRPARQAPLRSVGRSLELPYKTEGREPTLEERVGRLEQRLDASDAQLRDRIEAAEEGLRYELDRGRDYATEAADAGDEALRQFLHDQITGGLGRRATGAILFAAGVALTVAGNAI